MPEHVGGIMESRNSRAYLVASCSRGLSRRGEHRRKLPKDFVLKAGIESFNRRPHDLRPDTLKSALTWNRHASNIRIQAPCTRKRLSGFAMAGGHAATAI